MNREKHKLPRRILALLLTMAMCVTMFPTAMFAEIGTDNIEQTPVTEKEWDISKSKTATNLDENYESEVTLSLPSAQEELVSDVVFVLDKSTSTENRTDIKEMLTQLQGQIAAEGGKVKVGVVYFNKEANEALPLTPLTEETMRTIEAAVDQEYESGTNIHAGLLAGKKMLDDDDEVDSNRKYLILLSDGISYIYNEEPTSTFTIGYEMYSKNIKPSFVCSVDAWGSKYEYKTTLQSITNKENAIEAVETFLYDENGVASKVKNDNGVYDVSYDTLDEYIKSYPTAAGDTVGDSNSDANHKLAWKALKGNNKTAPVEKEIYSSLYGDEQDEHANNVEKAMYLVVETFKAAEDAGYQCYAIDPSVAPNETYPWGAELMDYLAKDTGDVSFAQIKEEIYYLLDAGSTIEDYMGYQSGEDGYDFDLVLGENNENLYMTIEAVDAQGNVTDESKTLQAQKLDDKYVFGDPDGNGTYPYELTYTDGAGDTEHFVWKTNVPVTNFERVQLHYTVKLAEPQKEAGSYGYYDADGDGLYDANLDDVDNDEAQVTDDMTPLYTNNSATLTAKDSNGENREEEFNKPSVSYTIAEEEPITITPADITIYTGGAGYGGVTDANGNIIQSTETTGLPEPGYHITLTESAVDWLSEQLGEDAGLTAQNLSEYLSFDYNNGGVTRHWDMKYVGIYDQDAYGRPTQYVYSLLPSKTEDPSEDLVPVRLMYWEDNDNDGEYDDGETVVNDDDIPMLANSVSKEYAMTINPGELDQGKIQATLKVNNNNTKTFDVNIGTGTLTVKSTTDDETTTMIASNENDVNSSTIQAVGNNVTYYVNDSEVEINNDSNRVQLLVDEISNNDGFNTTMGNDAIDRVADQFAGSADLSYDTAYMDLVDTENGNAVVTMGDDDWLDLYWPAPNNAAADSKYYIVHYTDMNRLEITDDVAQAAAKEIEGKRVTIGENDYIKFNVTSFSPFVLVWEEKEPYVPPYNPGTGDDDDEPPALNTEDHYLYIEGYPEDYRTGEYTDNEDLWPVKPQGNITRAEVATVFYRLLKDEVRDEVETDVNSFTDVNADDWFNITVSSLANMGIIAGYEDGSFRPNAPITRAEFAAIAARFFENNDVEYNEGLFEDITGDEWYADIVAAAVAHDLISGYPDGTMRPMANITRAEACAIVNRTIDRRPHDEHLCPVEEMRTWPDNQPGAWYYADMQEATNGHYYEWIDIDGSEFEEWTEVDKDYDWTKR